MVLIGWHLRRQQEVDKRSCQFTHSGEKYTEDQAWVLIQRYLRGKSLVAASGGKDTIGGGKGGGLCGEDLDDNGLVATHAYSVLEARELAKIPGLSITAILGKTKLIRLRNPWGSFEWKGAWGDGSPEWQSHPAIRRALKPEDVDDGTFWMPWEDFSRIFTSVDICDRTTTRDLKLQVNEDLGWFGVCYGCLTGCAWFICACKGLRVIYGGHRGSAETKSAKRGCCGGV